MVSTSQTVLIVKNVFFKLTFHFVEAKIFHKLGATAIFGGRVDFSAQTPHSMDSTLFLYDFSPAFDRK